jgi:ribosomal protein L7/L12
MSSSAPVLLVAIVVMVCLTLLVLGWRALRRALAPEVPRTPVPPTREGALQLIAEGRTVEAIRLVRTLSGRGLKGSKDAVDAVKRGEPLPPFPPREPAVAHAAAERDATLLALVAKGETLHAIARYRELTGAGLAESKDAVERLRGRG